MIFNQPSYQENDHRDDSQSSEDCNSQNSSPSNFVNKINFKILTLFPEIFPGVLNFSITADALKRNIWSYQAINIRDYASDSRKTVDDTPYGGSAGMVLKADVLANAIEKNLNSNIKKIIYFSPRGKVFNQQIARELSQQKEIMMLCARYEGIDQRVIDEFEIEEISLGDYVLSGGEIACFAVIDAILRNIKGVLGAQESLTEESFGNGENDEYSNLLEYPHYTRPAIWRNRKVPEVLLSGHHLKIKQFRYLQAQEITARIRPDLYLKNNHK
jgi:tRNA (guanine37-N1)-methyltransferase